MFFLCSLPLMNMYNLVRVNTKVYLGCWLEALLTYSIRHMNLIINKSYKFHTWCNHLQDEGSFLYFLLFVLNFYMTNPEAENVISLWLFHMIH